MQFVHNIISILDGAMNQQTDLIIMDFAKALDKVPHRRLLHKLDYYGIRGSTHKWISSWLSGHSQQVVLDGQASDPVPVLSGVPLGSVLGPILFLIFISNLLNQFDWNTQTSLAVRTVSELCGIVSSYLGRWSTSIGLRIYRLFIIFIAAFLGTDAGIRTQF